jgi:hypothetical protein
MLNTFETLLDFLLPCILQYFCFHYSIWAELFCILSVKYEDMECNWVAMFVCRHLSLASSSESSSDCGTHYQSTHSPDAGDHMTNSVGMPAQRDARGSNCCGVFMRNSDSW